VARTKTPNTPAAEFVRLLWRAPLLSLPFALFFTVVMGAPMAWLGRMFLVALVFSYVIGLSVWTMGWWEHRQASRGRIVEAKTSGKGTILTVARYMGVSMFGTFLAAGIIHFTIVPGFLGSARAVSVVLLYGLLFSVLFIGVIFAFHFYEHALARARSEEELNLARRIQRSFLISNFPESPGLEVYALNVSSKEVSGDFYDVVPVGVGGFLLCIADVSGKGVPAALLGSMLQASLRTQAPARAEVGAVVTAINRLVCEISPAGQFATLFLAHVDETTLRFTYVNAGHNPPALLRPDGTRVLLEVGGPVVGVSELIPYDQATLQLAPGDRVVFYTDGLSEGMNARKEMYGDDRAVEFAAGLPATQNPREQIDAMLGDLDRFLAGVEPQDDITLMVLRVRAGAGAGAATAAAAPALAAAPRTLEAGSRQ
jgi:serine phosphatase RsbU (regulator of sigma subunit)